MRAAGRPARAQSGMTLVELMVAVTILGVVVAAAFSVAFSIMNSYREHRRATNVERSARGAISVLTDAVRSASPGVPDGDITDLVSCDPSLHGIQVVNATGGPDALDVVYALGGVVTSLRETFADASATVPVEDGRSFQAGDQVLVTDFDRGHLFAVASVVTAGTPDAPLWSLVLEDAPRMLCQAVAPFTYPVRSSVLRVQRARFSVRQDPVVPALLMDRDGQDPDGAPPDTAARFAPEPVAEGVEDLQIAIGVDRDGDGVLVERGVDGNDDDWVYNHPADTDLPPVAARPYRALRLTVIARSIGETSRSPVSRRPAAEDRDESAERDEFRRRSLSTTVEIRNFEGSP